MPTSTMLAKTIPLGSSVPPMTAHAISVSLPLWADNIAYEEGDKRVTDKMETGYPRFFIHRSIQKLAALCVAKFGKADDEQCILLPSAQTASNGRDFLAAQTPSIPARIVEFAICPSSNFSSSPTESEFSRAAASVEVIELQILLFDKANWSFAKAFWQHTGDGISSRMAERALALLGETPAGKEKENGHKVETNTKSKYSRNSHYSRRGPSITSTPSSPAIPQGAVAEENLTPDLSTYLEERYGRNLPLASAPLAKQALKRRIAGGLLPSDEDFGQAEDLARGAGSGKAAVQEEDVYLYPGGMSAIWHAHNIARVARRQAGEPEGKSVCYGFPYTDTLKVISKWGPGSHFFGVGGSEEIDTLADLLASRDASTPRILALFAEFPSNPLLRSPDLEKLRKLADQYGFYIVIDETIGNFINVEVATFADIIVSSLTKIFSGDANVMGGSLILNPNGPHYEVLKRAMAEEYEDNYYPEDAIYMERNSRDYRSRIKRVNDNASLVTDYLYSRSLADQSTPAEGKVIKEVYYPKFTTPENYAKCQRFPTTGKGGFGGLFSITFTTLEASKAFYDTLSCAKGPSLGTSFTLASPYTILAHYLELDWAAKYGVEAGLVRISVGQETAEVLRSWFHHSVESAEATLKG
ncbi:hypothetical protein P7C73_g2720, partial [Tremellales sp. Uapishka_1]